MKLDYIKSWWYIDLTSILLATIIKNEMSGVDMLGYSFFLYNSRAHEREVNPKFK